MMNQVAVNICYQSKPSLAQLYRTGVTAVPEFVQRMSLAVALSIMPAASYAQTVSGGASPQTMINNVCTFILGPFGQTLAVLGIIAIGVLFMFGRASLGIIAGIIGGIVIMFGASYLGQTLTGG
jgi:type IV secretion system protein VirB2